jgi:hypothetical protein
VKYGGIVLDHPCTPGLRSRWEPKNLTDCDPTELYSETNSSLHSLLSSSGDKNPYMRDVYFPEEGMMCNETDTEPEVEIEVNGHCWRRVHDEHMSLYDVSTYVSVTLLSFLYLILPIVLFIFACIQMTYWVGKHPGLAYPITKWWSNGNGTILVYPSLKEGNEHGMMRWNNNYHKFTYVGRFGDTIRLGDLPNDLRRTEVVDYFDTSTEGENSQVLVCGSPGEISSDKEHPFVFDVDTQYSTVSWDTGNNRKYVWIMVSLSAVDQLRQRVAWALSQVSFKVHIICNCHEMVVDS